MTERLSFFATRNDLASALAEAERSRPLKYVRAGRVASGASISEWAQADNIPDLGVSAHGDQMRDEVFLLLPRSAPIVPRTVTLKRGGVRTFIDQQNNPQSVVLRPGGSFDSMSIIAGELSTISPHAESVSLFELLSEKLRSRFRRVKNDWLGEEAFAAFRAGARLTTSLESPSTYDLQLE